MHHTVWIIGVIMALTGIGAVLKPDWMKRMIVFFTGRHRFQAVAVVKLVIGVLFLIVARETRHWQVIVALGILIIVSNMAALLVKPETAQRYMLGWQKQPPWIYRLWGVVAVLFAALVIYAGWPHP